MSLRTPRIMVAPNGARHGKAAHPALPMTEEELVETAVRCREAGAQAIHIHVRDDAGLHVLDAERYNSAVRAIRKATTGGMLVQVTTETVGRYQPEDIARIFEDVDAPAFSVAVREFFPQKEHEELAAQTLARAQAQGRAIQYLVYAPTELTRLLALIEQGVIPDKNLDVLFVLGRYGDVDTDPASLIKYLNVLHASPMASRIEWGACAFGPPETRALTAALALGGKARVGFENSFYNADGSIAPDNAMRVAEVARIADQLSLHRLS